MRRTRSVAKVAIAAMVAVGVMAQGPLPAGAATAGPRAKMYRATNRSRSKHSVKVVDMHYRIAKLARRHSVAMAKKGNLFHTANAETKYLDGIAWSTWGENVGMTDGTIAGLEQAFMDSPLHRANILNRDFRRVAVGTYRDDQGSLWVTVFFYG